jgi:general stress protein 26
MAHSTKHSLHQLLEGFDTAMLITHVSSGKINARPMGLAEISETGEIYFATSKSSAKVHEIKKDSDVTLIFQGKMTFVAVDGTASILEDKSLVDRLWSETWRVWFPKGKTDPSLRFLKVTPSEAEFWDSSGLQGMNYAFEAARAYIKGDKPHVSKQQHGKISL